MSLPGIEQVDGNGKKVDLDTDIVSQKEEQVSSKSREGILNMVLLVLVFVLISLFAYLFFTDRLVVGVENPLSKGQENINSEESSEKLCIYDGKEYINGESFDSTDGCNTCSCVDGEEVCTLMACGSSALDTIQVEWGVSSDEYTFEFVIPEGFKDPQYISYWTDNGVVCPSETLAFTTSLTIPIEQIDRYAFFEFTYEDSGVTEKIKTFVMVATCPI
jgi:hypothetical protein